MPTLGDAVAPAPLQRRVDDAREVTAHGDTWAHQEGQEAAPHITCGPSCPAAHLVVQAAIGCIVPAHLAQGGRHGPPTTGSERPDDQHLHFTPGGWRKRRLKRTSYSGHRC
jgi:hypothetical protein